MERFAVLVLVEVEAHQVRSSHLCCRAEQGRVGIKLCRKAVNAHLDPVAREEAVGIGIKIRQGF